MLSALLGLALAFSPPPDRYDHSDSLAGKVVIHRDEFGVPHIFAGTVENGFYGLGYAQSEDILELILMLVLRGRGELASAQGEAMLGSDVEHRRWQHREAARSGFGRLSPLLQGAYRSWIAGVQAFMADHPDAVPA